MVDNFTNFNILQTELTHRIMVGYIRHTIFQKYDVLVNAIAGCNGETMLYQLIKEKILKSIKDAMPELTQECDRQIGELNER